METQITEDEDGELWCKDKGEPGVEVREEDSLLKWWDGGQMCSRSNNVEKEGEEKR